MEWFFIGGGLIIVLSIYAHYESSRAAYFRAKAREVHLRMHATQDAPVQSPMSEVKGNVSREKLVIDGKVSELIQLSPLSVVEQRNKITEDKNVVEIPPKGIVPPWKAKWEQLAVKFDEREAGNIMLEWEQEDQQDYEDYFALKDSIPLEPEMISVQHSLEEVNLDEDAMAFLKQIGIVQVPKALSGLLIPMEDSEVEQELMSFDIEPASEHRVFPTVTTTLGNTPSFGIHFVKGDIVEKYDDELVRLQDETGSRIISHKRFHKFNLGDQVICQVTVMSSGWTCVQAWSAPQDDLLLTG